MKSVYPALYFNYLNSVAYELGATGELAAAQYYNALAMRTPYAARYPEWQETEQEIREQLQQPTTAQIFVPEATAQAYQHCFDNVYRLNSFYEFQSLSREAQPTAGTPATKRGAQTESDKCPAAGSGEKNNVHFFPSPEALATPRRQGKGVFEVRVLYGEQRRSLYIIPELEAAPYADWFTGLEQLEPSPESPFLLQVVFSNGVEEFIFTSKPVTREVIEKLRLPALPKSVTVKPLAEEILQLAKRLLAAVEENFSASS